MFTYKLLFVIVLLFMLFTIVGTLTHESAHYGVANYLGCRAKIRFNSTSYGCYKLHADYAILITMAGPLQTMIVGTIGHMYVIYNKKYYTNLSLLSPKHWLGLFMAFFWLREVFMGISTSIQLLFIKNYESSSDEYSIADYYNLPPYSLVIVTSIIGILVSCHLLLLIPIVQRKIFLKGALIGSISGYVLWMKMIGPLLLP